MASVIDNTPIDLSMKIIYPREHNPIDMSAQAHQAICPKKPVTLNIHNNNDNNHDYNHHHYHHHHHNNNNNNNNNNGNYENLNYYRYPTIQSPQEAQPASLSPPSSSSSPSWGQNENKAKIKSQQRSPVDWEGSPLPLLNFSAVAPIPVMATEPVNNPYNTTYSAPCISPPASVSSQPRTSSLSPDFTIMNILYNKNNNIGSSSESGNAIANLPQQVPLQAAVAETTPKTLKTFGCLDTPQIVHDKETNDEFAVFRTAMLHTVKFEESTNSKMRRKNPNAASSADEEKKDPAYLARRSKNNLAAKRSRDLRRAKECETTIKAAFFEKVYLRQKNVNQALKAHIAQLEMLVLQLSNGK